MVENAEALINQNGFSDVRARYHKGEISIEVPANEVTRLREILQKLMPLLQKIRIF